MQYRMNVCSSLDDNYAKYTVVMLKSLFMNNRDAEIYVYLLCEHLNKASFEALKEVCEEYGNHLCLLIVDTTMIDSRIYASKDWSIEAVYRLEMLDLLPGDLDRMLYLDVDMIINKPIKELYLMDFDSNEVIAANDMSLKEEVIEYYRETRAEIFDSIIESHRYFNSGMIVFNLKLLRERGYCLKEYMKLAETIDYRVFAPDQDILNLAHHASVLLVEPLKYNFFAGVGIDIGYDYERTKNDVSIVHFAGKKPWQSGNHMNYTIERIWWDYALDTSFRDVFLTNFVLQAMSDMSMREYIQRLLEENGRLKEDLNAAVTGAKRLMEALSKG